MNKPQISAENNSLNSRNTLLAEERKLAILAELQQTGKVTVAQLSQSLNVSEDTVRRDLRDLARANKLRKVHGGAMPISPSVKPYKTRSYQDQDLKLELAKVAAKLAQDGQVIFVDSGTTCLAIAQSFDLALSATIVTTSPHVAIALENHKKLEIILIGGNINTDDMTVVGATAYNSLQKIHADLCFLGVCSIHISMGITTIDHEQAQLKSIMIENATKTVATATADKLNTAAAFHICDTSSINYIVTDASEETGSGLEPYRNLGIQIVEV